MSRVVQERRLANASFAADQEHFASLAQAIEQGIDAADLRLAPDKRPARTGRARDAHPSRITRPAGTDLERREPSRAGARVGSPDPPSSGAATGRGVIPRK